MRRWVLALAVMVGIAFFALDFMQKGIQDLRTEPVPAAGTGQPLDDAALERARLDRLANAKQIVTTLSQIDVRPGAFTPEKVEASRQSLLALVNDGREAVPAIAEYLQTNADVRFDSGRGTVPLEERTLRLALIRVLFDTPTPDNVDLQMQVLRVTRDPDEVLLLARQLEMQEPGKHRAAIIAAARASLDSARRGKFPGRDTSGLAKLLERYGEK